MVNIQVILFLLFCVTFKAASSDCDISIQDDLVEPQPIFIVPGTEMFWDPDPNGILKIPAGKDIEMFCSEEFIEPLAKKTLVKAVCVDGKNFKVDEKSLSFNQFVCTKNSSHIAQRTGQSCYNRAIKVDVGYAVGERFLKTFDVCFNEDDESTFYVHYKLNPSSNAFQKSVQRPNFIKGDFYGKKDVDELYTKIKQKETIGRILSGGQEKYFNEEKSLFLARGHLSAQTDHIYGSQQISTFYFINAAPQWQIFNAGNWEKIEASVRKFVADKRIQVDCYTGTWGVSELHDINGNPQKLYLYMDANNNGQIPVPKIYYRIVVEPATKRGIAFIGVNNPHVTLEQIKKDYVVCPDLSDKINWINWKKDDISTGYSYACDVNDFLKAVPHVQNLAVEGLLSAATPATVIQWGFSKLLTIIITMQIFTKLYL